ncbi:MAG TPA: type II secretion system protein GspC [Steroidobacteraceae bacterium]|nr:type II secretion system protein GspC [Steroidobacteraceae bacterium]
MNAASWLEGLPAPDKWRALMLTHGPRAATWALALALSVQAAVIVTNLAGAGRSPKVSATTTPVPLQRRSVDVAAIINAHLTGVSTAAAPSAQDAANAPQTTMPLVLTGIIAEDNPQDGLAILGENAGAAKVYAVGDNIPGGAKLHSVYVERVVIDRNGHLESLTLPRQAQGAAPPPSAAALQTESPVMDRMRKLISDDPGLMADIMRPQPVFAGGKQKGYRVYPGRNRAAFGRLGLHPGDLVTAINGTPLDDPARGQEIFRTLGSSSEAHITVMRGGQQQDLTLNIAQVAQEAEALVGSQGDQGQPVPPPPSEPPNQPDSSQ